MSSSARVVLHLDLDHLLGVLADQVAGADVAADLAHLGHEAGREQHRIAALAAHRRHDDGAPLERVEGGDQPVDLARP